MCRSDDFLFHLKFFCSSQNDKFSCLELIETTRKLEVLEHFFNKKEAELQKQLGLQSAR